MIDTRPIWIGLALLAIAGLSDAAGATAETSSEEVLNRSQPKVVRYAKRLLARYDADKSGDLSEVEWKDMRGRPAILDHDGSGRATLEELVLHISEYGRYRRLGERGVLGPASRAALKDEDARRNGEGPESLGVTEPGESREVGPSDAPFYVPENRRPSNLPSWFTQRDRNGDGQISLVEYAPTGSREAVTSFKQHDANQDGLITPAECARPAKQPAKDTKSGAAPSGEKS